MQFRHLRDAAPSASTWRAYTFRLGRSATTSTPADATVPAWEPTPQAFADALETAERRCHSIGARDIVIGLPEMLEPHERTALVKAFAQELSDRYDPPIVWALRPPAADGADRNRHAHLLTHERDGDPGSQSMP